MEVDGMQLTIVGVMPEGFVTPGAEDEAIWPLLEIDIPQRRGPFYLFAVGRLGEGTSLADASADLDRTRVALNGSYPEEDWRYDVRPLRDAVVGDVSATLWLLMAAVSLVLVIAVANVANLLLSRATVRVREVAVRSALGARPSRLVRQLLTESAVLGLLGALAGLGLAYGGVALIGEIGTSFVPRLHQVEVDAAVLGFTLAVGLGAGLAAGIAPALQSPWRRIAALVRDAGRAGTTGGGSGRLRYGLVVAEFALALTVISAAGLLMQSLLRIESEELGYRTENLLSFRLHLPEAEYGDGEPLTQFLDQLEERLGELPPVRGVGFSMSLPPTELSMTNNYTVQGEPPRTRGSQSVAEWTQVSEAYFATLGIPLLSGRVFETSDARDAPAVVVVNAAFARRHFPDGSALGQRIQGGRHRPEGSWSTIVGVVGDVPYAAGAAGGMQPTVYTPYRQQAWWQRPWVSIRTRPGADAAQVLDAARSVVRELEPGVPFRHVATMEERVARSQAPARFRSLLFALLAAVALGLATTGIFGVMAYTIDQRRRETAIRMALGADAGRTIREVLGKAGRVSGLGLAVGLAAALAATRSLSPVLYETDPFDLPTFLGGAALLLLVALAASWIPTLAALRTDPASTLRED